MSSKLHPNSKTNSEMKSKYDVPQWVRDIENKRINFDSMFPNGNNLEALSRTIYNNKLDSQDLLTFKELGLNVFNVPHDTEFYVGKVDNEYWAIRIWVDCTPVKFWKFEIYNKEAKGVTHKFRTGSGGFTEYWKVAKMFAEGMIEFESVKLK